MAALSKTIVSEIEEVKRTFGAIEQGEKYSPTSFGDAELILSGPRLSARFVRERGKVFLDLRHNDDDWQDANLILEALGLHPTPREQLPIVDLVRLVCANANAIVNAVS